MTTIKEKAIAFAFGQHCVIIGMDSNGDRVVEKCPKLSDSCICARFEKTREKFVEIATEQDRIARAEERERVMSAVVNVLRRTYYFDSEEGFSEEAIKDQFIQCVNAELEKGDQV